MNSTNTDIQNQEPSGIKTITIEDKEYNIDSFTDEQKYFLSQVLDCENKIQGLNFQVNQVQAAKLFFIQNLKVSLTDEIQKEENKE